MEASRWNPAIGQFVSAGGGPSSDSSHASSSTTEAGKSGSRRQEEWSHMDDRRFDQLAIAIAGEPGSRREALGLAAGGAIAALLGFLGMGETALARRGKKNGGGNNNNHKHRNKDKTKKICHCKDSTGNNCKTKKLSAKKAKRHLKNHPNDYKGKCNKDNGCNDIGNACAVANPGGCCANKCCSINQSTTSGICPTQNATCCTQRQAGGYCTAETPQCCGEAACCTADQVCCPTSGGGRCCAKGQTCGLNSCVNAQGAQVAEQTAGRRGR
jgi:hypothetical protein